MVQFNPSVSDLSKKGQMMDRRTPSHNSTLVDAGISGGEAVGLDHGLDLDLDEMDIVDLSDNKPVQFSVAMARTHTQPLSSDSNQGKGSRLSVSLSPTVHARDRTQSTSLSPGHLSPQSANCENMRFQRRASTASNASIMSYTPTASALSAKTRTTTATNSLSPTHTHQSSAAAIFTSQLRFSPLSTNPQLLALVHALSMALTTLRLSEALSPWDYADVVTNVDVAVHLHTVKDPNWAKDVLQVGISLANAAVLSLTPLNRLVVEMAIASAAHPGGDYNGDGGENAEQNVLDVTCCNDDGGAAEFTQDTISEETKKRILDLMEFFRLLVLLGPQSCYLTRKFLKAFQGGWYTGKSMEDLAKRLCVEDRWWIRRRIVW
ncbi:hypothetical protein HDU81_009728 [Chytriomyces hyalinus]|nr:hypothetical protein HDU81_009728 [Chytriomyces hyalinus]